jgi:2-keto-4-pentenoate hydratase
MTGKFEKLAADLARAWRDGSSVPLPAASAAPSTRAEAYAVQDRMAELIGGRVVGWKVGATVRPVQVFEGHDGPLPGRIFADRCFDSPAKVKASLIPGIKAECEFAFRLKRPLPKQGKPFAPEEIAPALSFHPAIELSATRYAPGTGARAQRTFDGIADNGLGGGAVLGPAVDPWRSLAFETMQIDARIDASPPIQAYSGAYRRDPLVIMAETLNDLAARGIHLGAGDCVLTGSATLPTPLRPGQTLAVRFADLATVSVSLI